MGRAEASILADIAHQFWQIPHEKIWVEDQSTNCGENARFSVALISQAAQNIHTAIVVQDPTMQRRTMATFRRVTGDNPDAPRWLSCPGFIPQLQLVNTRPEFVGGNSGIWTIDRYLSLLTGELPRLHDDENGYGPRGRDFIVHVEIPHEVETAWQVIQHDETLMDAINSRSLR